MRRIITEQDKKILDKYSDHLMTRMPGQIIYKYTYGKDEVFFGTK